MSDHLMIGLIQYFHSDYPGRWHILFLVGQGGRNMRKKIPPWESFGLLQSTMLSKDFLKVGKTVFFQTSLHP